SKKYADSHLKVVMEKLENHNSFSPDDMDGNGAYHLVVRHSKDDTIQYIETRKTPSICPIDYQGLTHRKYLVNRLAALRYSTQLETPFLSPCRLLWDNQTRDTAFLYHENDIEILGILPPTI